MKSDSRRLCLQEEVAVREVPEGSRVGLSRQGLRESTIGSFQRSKAGYGQRTLGQFLRREYKKWARLMYVHLPSSPHRPWELAPSAPVPAHQSLLAQIRPISHQLQPTLLFLPKTEPSLARPELVVGTKLNLPAQMGWICGYRMISQACIAGKAPTGRHSRKQRWTRLSIPKNFLPHCLPGNPPCGPGSKPPVLTLACLLSEAEGRVRGRGAAYLGCCRVCVSSSALPVPLLSPFTSLSCAGVLVGSDHSLADLLQPQHSSRIPCHLENWERQDPRLISPGYQAK